MDFAQFQGISGFYRCLAGEGFCKAIKRFQRYAMFIVPERINDFLKYGFFLSRLNIRRDTLDDDRGVAENL